MSGKIIEESLAINNVGLDGYIRVVSNDGYSYRMQVQTFVELCASAETIQKAVDAWLEEHPEAVTTVQDGSITEVKLSADLQETLHTLVAAVGGPNAAATVADMTDQSKVYVYTGSESGYTAGNWYYFSNGVWVSGGVYNSTALETDTTLSVAGMAADAKATGDQVAQLKKDLNTGDSVLFNNPDNTFPLEFEGGTYRQTAVGSALEKYYGGGYDKTRKVLKSTVVNAPVDITLTANSGYQMNVFESSSGVITKAENGLTSKTLVSSKQYGIVLRSENGTDDISGLDASDIINIEYSMNTDKTLSVSGMAADAKATGVRLTEIEGVLFESNSLDFTDYGTYNVLIGSSEGKWSNNPYSHSYIIPINSSDKKVEITANQTSPSVFAMLKTSAHQHATYPDYATGSGRTVINAGETQLFHIPDDCNFLYFLKDYTTTDNLPSLVEIISIKEINPENLVYPLGLHEMPDNDGVLNMIKRCRQLTDIKWTPAVDLPRFMLVQRSSPVPDTAGAQNYLGTFKSGVEYTGVPYGRVNTSVSDYGYSYGTVGHYIGFDSFISSVGNKDSRLCKDDISTVSEHRSVIYATVCSGLTCYALNVPERPTASIGNISGMTQIGKLNDNGTLLDDSLIKLGDVLNDPGVHTAVVTDIIRDNDGVIQFIELSDASTNGLADRNYSDGHIGGVCRRKGWTREQLFTAGSWGDYYVLRYSKANEIPYVPSPYVNVGDEPDMWRIEHYPCMPYEGEGFVFKAGYIPNNAVKILVSLTGYAYLRVFKDGTEITGSPFSATGVDSIDVTEISAGSYKAYLCNMNNGDVTNLTAECHWSIT